MTINFVISLLLLFWSIQPEPMAKLSYWISGWLLLTVVISGKNHPLYADPAKNIGQSLLQPTVDCCIIPVVATPYCDASPHRSCCIHSSAALARSPLVCPPWPSLSSLLCVDCFAIQWLECPIVGFMFPYPSCNVLGGRGTDLGYSDLLLRSKHQQSTFIVICSVLDTHNFIWLCESTK